LATGEFLAKKMGLLNGEWIIRGDQWTDLRLHQYFGGSAVFFGFLCIRSAYLKRKEHQGLGTYALLTGLLWAVSAGGAGHYGFKMARAHKTWAPATAALMTDAEDGDQAVGGGPAANRRMMRILDYASLLSMHAEPVRSAPHKNRWIRVWVSPNAAEAYTQGSDLPEGSLVVMSSVEDRGWRPSYEIGPLYALEVMPDGKPRVSMHWSNVPESKREETGGLDRAYWTEPNANLASCAECHAEGMASPKNRSRARYAAPKRPTETETHIQTQTQAQTISQ
jgi:hypothetical protein